MRALWIPLVLPLVMPPPASAQAVAALRGTVLSEAVGEPVGGATVQLVGTDVAAVTDADGGFHFLSVPIGTSIIRISHVGHATLSERLDVSRPTLLVRDFHLMAPEYVLEEVVARALRRPHIPDNAVAGADVRKGHTVSEALDGVSGVTLVRTGGEVGRGFYLRVRGAKSFAFNRLPVVYLDGVRMHGGGVGGGLGILELLSPETIGRVEVLRGSAAEARFGPDASNGVVLITTRRGGGHRY